MGFKRVAVAALLMVALVAMVGCGRSSKVNPARLVAEEFYRGAYLNGDPGRAYDLAVPDLWGPGTGSREEFVQQAEEGRAKNPGSRLPANAELRISEFDRAGDWLYLIRDARSGHLIWVTKTDKGWLVRKTMPYEEGMIIPWS